MNLKLGDLLVDERSESQGIGRPYSTAAGKTVHVRVESVKRAHEWIMVKRVSKESKG